MYRIQIIRGQEVLEEHFCLNVTEAHDIGREVASAYEAARYTVGPEEATCKCGMWPISEYGARCPSCSLEEAS